MLVSRDSWHYRFMTYMRVYPGVRTDLCSYARGFMLSLLKLAYTIVAGGFLTFLAVVLLFFMGYALLAGLLNLDTTSPAWLLGAVLWLFVCFGGALYVIKKISDRWERKAPGLFKQYVIDRHDKVCRMIEFQ